jgi:hypothetical protein
MERAIIDITGRRFGKLIASSYSGKDKNSNKLWLCQCDCGGGKIVRYAHLKSLHITSCGCLKGEVLVARNLSHGESRTKLYSRYSGMIARCENPKHISWSCHGGRGITVCDEWRKDYMSFKTWSEESGFKPDLILDRNDGDKGYSPDNCRWVTRTVNNQNARPRNGKKYRGVRSYKGKYRADIQVDK